MGQAEAGSQYHVPVRPEFLTPPFTTALALVSHSLYVPSSVDDWDIVERIWRHANQTNLQVDLSQTPLLLVERSFNTPK